MADLALIGLGQLAVALGKSLRATLKSVGIAGYDPDSKLAQQAIASGAINEAKRSIPEAIAGASVIVLATPIEALERAMQVVGQCAPIECVVTDLSPLKGPVLEWAERHVPPGVDFVGGHAMVRDATAPLLEGAPYAIVPRPQTSREGVDAVVNLAKAVGAHPYFIDATEHDSFAVAAHYLPRLAAAAAVDAAIRSPSWPDLQRFWNETFNQAIATADMNPFELSLVWRANPSALEGWLTRLAEQITRMRGEVAAINEDSAAIAAIQQAVAERKRGLAETGGVDSPKLERPSTAGLLFGDWLANRTRRNRS